MKLSKHPKDSRGKSNGGYAFGWLRAALEVRKKISIPDRWAIYLWAVAIGVVGAFCALCFDQAVKFVQAVLTGLPSATQLGAFQSMPPWRIVMVPAAGGLLAGITLLFTQRYLPAKATEYREAIALGDGYVPARSSLLRSLSAVFTIGSGAAIGREGPLIQTAAVAGSAIGCRLRLSAPRQRLLVACAAAAGMSAAFHTPLAGGFFVSEIVLGALTVDILAPVLAASCAGFLTLSFFGMQNPIYQADSIALSGNMKVVLCCIVLGVLASFAAQGWLWLLKRSRALLNGKRVWLPLRLALAGAFVGLIAIWYPHIVGNGANMIRGLVESQFTLETGAVLLVLKVVAVAVVFGVGTVGGVLTPSLTIGCMLGFLFNWALLQLGVQSDHAIAYSLVGMAAFFTTAANAPMTSLILVIEFSMAGGLIFPLIVAVLVSCGVARLCKVQSMYHDSLIFGPRSVFAQPLWKVSLKDIARKTPHCVRPDDTFGTIAPMLLKAPSQTIFMTTASGRYLGVILARDILDFAKNRELADAVIAADIAHTELPTLSAQTSLPKALEVFANNPDGRRESLPLVDPDSGQLLGVLNKADLYLALSEIMRYEKVHG